MDQVEPTPTSSPAEGAEPAWIVPSASWPTLAAAVACATDGTHIEVQSGYVETLSEPLILDRAVFIEGPLDGTARLTGDESIVVAGDAVESTVVLRRLELQLSASPAILVAGGCTIEACTIEGPHPPDNVGIEVTAGAGRAARILNSVVRGCQTGISLSGGAATVLAGTRVELCTDGVVITGLNVKEGWNEVFGRLENVTFEENSGANMSLRGWSVLEKSGTLRLAPPGEEVAVRGWPLEACNVVAPTDRGPVVLHFTGGQVNATLFEDDEEDDTAADFEDALETVCPGHLPCSLGEEALALQTASEP